MRYYSYTHLFTFLFLTLLLSTSYAQTEHYSSSPATTQKTPSLLPLTYQADMLAAISDMDKAMSTQALRDAAGRFDIIARQAPSEWLPPYYASYCFTVMAFMTKRDLALKDTYLISAQYHLDQTAKIDSNNVEVAVLQAYIYQMKVDVNPANRLEQYGTLAALSLEEAISIDPENPRIYYLKAQNFFFAPEYAGGGLGKACPIAQVAASKYTKHNTPSPLHPKWGAAMTNYMQQVCGSVHK